MDQKVTLMNEIRYAQRITQRTARLYRRASTVLTFLAILGGSSVAVSLSKSAPDWLAIVGTLAMAAAAAASLAVRPLEKAITNEQDLRKYTQLETLAVGMTLEQLQAALAKARETDAAEVELLRDVAYNDVVREIGRDDAAIHLNLQQRLIASLA